MRRFVSLLLALSLSGFLLAGIPPQQTTSQAGQQVGGVPPRQTTSPAAPVTAQQVGGTEPLAIVVNRSNAVENLSMAELRKIFLGERSHWPNPNGRRISLVMREPGWPEREAVLSSIFQMTETEFNNHFLHGLFTGEVFVSPKTLATPEGIRKFIFNVPGAIGYLRISDVDKTVKVIQIDKRFPEEKGYKLHVPSRQNR